MKVAIVHDFLREFGGAERVLRVLTEMYPTAPIYTAFKVNGSVCEQKFLDRKIVESKLSFLLKKWSLYSPLRLLIPWVWRSMDLSGYDLVISSCSSYIARGFRVSDKTRVMAYCHTPPRFLYGYETSVDWKKYWIVRLYALIVNHFLRIYDLWSSEMVDLWLVNSNNVAERVRKFYKRESVVVYPPVEVKKIMKAARNTKKEDYFLIVSRLVGAKGLVEAAEAAKKLGFKLKIVGEAVGFSGVKKELEELGAELLGRVEDDELLKLYAKAKGFIALAKDEDFGMTVVEAMAAGTPVIAFNGGGFRESVVEGVSGVLIDGVAEESIQKGMSKFKKVKWKTDLIQKQAEKFSREQFEKKISYEVERLTKNA